MVRARIVFVVLSATVVLSAAGLLMAKKGQNEELYKALGSLAEVVHLVHAEYVDEVDLGALAQSLEAGIVQSIDTDAAVLPQEVVEDYRGLLEANPPYGLVLGLRFASAAVRGTIIGSPAAGAGLERWEVVELVDEINTRGRPLWQIKLELLEKERAGKTVKLTVFDQAMDERRDVELVPKQWQPQDPESSDQEVATSIELNHLASGSAAALEKLLTSERPLILDLRSVVWGFEDEAIRIADLFAADGVLGQWRGRRAGEKVFSATNDDGNAELPIVLINHNTQGVGEILAAALKRQGATLVGTKTAGLAHHMRLIHDRDLYLWLPIGSWLREDDQPITRNGVEPSLEVEYREVEEGADPILEEALALLRQRLEAAA